MQVVKPTLVLQMKEQVFVEFNKLSATKKCIEAICVSLLVSCEIELGG